MDRLDVAIAAVLQRDGSRTLNDIAAEVGLSASATQRRVARLRQEGAISADVCILSPKAFGFPLTFVVEIVLEKVRVREVNEIKKKLKAAPEVQQVYNITGDADLLLILLARDVEHFEQISRDLFSADPHVRRYRTSLVVDRVKSTLTIPLDLPKRKRAQ